MRYYIQTEDFIAHHGILGQKWGRKNGPPYPLSSAEHASVVKKAKNGGASGDGKESSKVKKKTNHQVRMN